MTAPPAAYKRLREAYRKGQYQLVVDGADHVAAVLHATPDGTDHLASLAVLQGSALAAESRFAEAEQKLALGLTWFDGREDEARDIGGIDYFELRLLEVRLLLGLYGAAWASLATLEEPDRRASTRLAAIRARAAMNTIRGDYEGAHQLLNAAASLASRLTSTFLETLVECDRAVVLATQGRLHEGVLLADRTFERMARPAAGSKGAWAASTTAGVALTLSRFLGEAGRPADAERLLLVGTAAAERAATPYLRAQVDVTISALWRVQGSPGTAEPLCGEASVILGNLGCRPAAAYATFELGRIALARGLLSSAEPLLRRAQAEFEYLGHARDGADADAVLASIHPAAPSSDDSSDQRTVRYVRPGRTGRAARTGGTEEQP